MIENKTPKQTCAICGRKRNCAVVNAKTKTIHEKAKRAVQRASSRFKGLEASIHVCMRCVKKGKL